MFQCAVLRCSDQDGNVLNSCNGVALSSSRESSGYIVCPSTLLPPSSVFAVCPEIYERNQIVAAERSLKQDVKVEASLGGGSYSRCEIAAIFVSKDVESFIQETDHALSGANKESTENGERVDIINALFLILQTSSSNPFAFPSLPKVPIAVGCQVQVNCTPFSHVAPQIFQDSIVSGIVSNAYKEDVFMIDSKVPLGCEGAPVFTYDEQNGKTFAGIVLFPLVWVNGEWLGMTICVRLGELLSSLSNGLDVSGATSDSSLDFSSFVICIKNASKWGTAVSVGKGYLLTCAHVVTNPKLPIHLHHWQSDKVHRAQLLYRNSRLPYDLALLRLGDSKLGCLDIDPNYARIGMPVYAVGFASFESHILARPSVTSGVISKVVRHNGEPAMLMTTCVVQSGMSGGPLVSEEGKLVGILVSHAKDEESGAHFPYVSIALPITAVWRHLDKFIRTGNPKALNLLQAGSKVQDIWALKPKSKL